MTIERAAPFPAEDPGLAPDGDVFRCPSESPAPMVIFAATRVCTALVVVLPAVDGLLVHLVMLDVPGAGRWRLARLVRPGG